MQPFPEKFLYTVLSVLRECILTNCTVCQRVQMFYQAILKVSHLYGTLNLSAVFPFIPSDWIGTMCPSRNPFQTFCITMFMSNDARTQKTHVVPIDKLFARSSSILISLSECGWCANSEELTHKLYVHTAIHITPRVNI